MGVLNRKDRRALLKKGNIENVVAGAINQTHSKIRLDTINDLMAMALMALNSEFGFGEKRLKKFHQKIASLGEELIAGTVELEDIREHLRDNCNVQF